jgi:hypothetical protein
MGTLDSRVTWLVPATLLAAILASWAACQLWRLHLPAIYPLANPLSPRPGEVEEVPTAGFRSRVGDLDARLKSARFLPAGIVDWLFLVLLAFGVRASLGVALLRRSRRWLPERLSLPHAT